jgi:hypothetical protein
MKMPRFLSLVIAISAWPLEPVVAEALIPSNVAFEFELQRDSAGSSCRLMVTFMSLPRPESGLLELVAGDGGAFGFSLAVIDLKFANKLPAGADPVLLESANVVGPSFSTLGRLNGSATARGGYLALASTEEDLAALLQTFVRGDYVVEFRRAGSSATRSYRIAQQPPPDVVQKWAACAKERTLRK